MVAFAPLANSRADRSDPATEGNAPLQDSPPPPSSSNYRGMSTAAPTSQISHSLMPPHPNTFENIGDPILEPEFTYVVYKVMEAWKAGFHDDMNDFKPDEECPMEIYKAWTKLGCPMSFCAFQMMLKGKGHAVDAVQAYSEPKGPSSPSSHQWSTSADQLDPLTGALSERFGLSEVSLKALSSKAVAKAQCLSSLPKGIPAAPKYKPLKGAAKEEACTLIDQTLTTLLQLSQQHGTDPTAATKLFQKKLNYFSSSLWDMWEMHHAVKRVMKGWEKGDGIEDENEEVCQSSGDDEVSGSDQGDGLQGASILQITAIYQTLH